MLSWARARSGFRKETRIRATSIGSIPKTGELQKRILIPVGGAQTLAFGDSALWVANADVGQVSRIDARTNEITSTPMVGDGNICCLAAGEGYAWVATNPDHQVWKIGGDGTVATSIGLAGVIENLTYADGAVWAAQGDAGTLVRIDATTNTKRAYRVGHHLIGVAARKGVIAVGVQESAADVTAGLKGRVVTVALKDDYLDWTSPDPAANAGRRSTRTRSSSTTRRARSCSTTRTPQELRECGSCRRSRPAGPRSPAGGARTRSESVPATASRRRRTSL